MLPPIRNIQPLRVYTLSEAADMAGMTTNDLWNAQGRGELHTISDLPGESAMGTAGIYVVGADLIRYRQARQGLTCRGTAAPFYE